MHFGTLTDQQKEAFSNMDINNIDLNDLVKTLTEVGGQAVLGRQIGNSTPWLTERHG